ncbi:MAG: hypothetical protein ACO22S_05655 [Burkholderiaceae bacterium]
MSTPIGAITTSAISLVKGVKDPTKSNIVGAATQLASLGNNQKVTNSVNAGVGLLTSAYQSLGQGKPFDTLGGLNQAVRLASGFTDPKTAAIASSVLGGINMLFGGGGVLGMQGNKPYALHTESMKAQSMASAYGEQNDVVFTFVRAGSSLEEAVSGGDAAATNQASTATASSTIGKTSPPSNSLAGRYQGPNSPTARRQGTTFR